MPGKLGATNTVLARLVERQMRNWELARAQRQDVPVEQRAVVGDFVAISREVGAGGRTVATLLGERLAWPVFDKEILNKMAGDDGLRRQIYDSMDERDIGWVEESLRSLMQPEFVRNDYLHRLTQTVLSLARQGGGVFLGRGSDRILPPDRGLRVRLVAPLEVRAQRYAERERRSLGDARDEIARIGKDRMEFVHRHFGIDSTDPTRYDLVINTAKLSPATAVDLIVAARQHVMIQRPDDR